MEIRELETSAIPSSTLQQQKYYVRKFVNFLTSKDYEVNFHLISASVLNEYLGVFYAQLRCDAGYYNPRSLICIRAAIHRHLISPEINSKLNIIETEDFRRSNNVLRAMAKILRIGPTEKSTI
jgi:hypothetical protein